MKTINETFIDEEMKIITKNKKESSWHDYILILAEYYNQAVKKGDVKIYKV